jgi:hypothetical protein
LESVVDAETLTRKPIVLAGGAKGGCFYSKRYAMLSGLNSTNLDFLPVQNIEEEVVVGGVGAVPVGKLECPVFM